MKIIIIGGGKVGRTLVRNLNDEGHDVVLIDIKSAVVEAVGDAYDVMCIEGSGTDITVLEEAGVRAADLIIAVTEKDEHNVLCGIMAKKMGAGRCVARVRNPEYYHQLQFMRDVLDINMIVNPEYLAANEISRILRFPAAMHIETFAKGRIELVEFKIDKDSPMADIPLFKLYSDHKVRILVCAVMRDNEVIIPKGDFILHAGDRIYVTSTHIDIAKFINKMHVDNQRVKSTLIIGGGRISFYLARMLGELGVKVKIIEQDMDKCNKLTDMLPKASIICADGTDRDVLIEEGIDSVDSFVSLTGIDEENIIVSMYAKQNGINKVITKINRLSFMDIVEGMGIDSPVTPKDITADVILGYVRAMDNISKIANNEIRTLYRIVGNNAEAIEFRVYENPDIVGIPLKDLRIKQNVIIAAVAKGNKIVIPSGNTVIDVGDHVIVVTTGHLKHLNEILL